MKKLTKEQVFSPFGLSFLFKSWATSKGYKRLKFTIYYDLPQWVVNIMLWRFGIGAITLGRWIFYFDGKIEKDNDYAESMIMHELVHIQQYKKYTWIGFWTIYLWNFVTKGYMNVPFEKEAYAIEAEFKKLLKMSVSNG